MKVAAIICEYHPFHNGHLYQLKKAKEILHVDYVIALMSGNYVQRGTPAFLNKETRTQMALSCGVDLVLELPLWFSCGSASYFASGAIALLSSLHIVDYLVFGSECDDLDQLESLVDLYTTQEQQLKEKMEALCKQGLTYPAARQKALQLLRPSDNISDLMHKPNNLLAFEYLLALKQQKSDIMPFSIKRHHNNYHDTNYHQTISSATAIRTQLEKTNNTALIQHAVPEEVYRILYQKNMNMITMNDFSDFLGYQMMMHSDFTEFWDISKDFSQRMKKQYQPTLTCYNFIEVLKNKSLTWSRISRSLLHLMLNLKQKDVDALKKEQYQLYFQLLGFRKSSSKLIRSIKNNKTWPMVMHLHPDQDPLSSFQMHLLTIEKQANDLYYYVESNKYHITTKHQQIIV